jgi:hypothetical protein
VSLVDGTQYTFPIAQDSLVRTVKLELEKLTAIKVTLQRLMHNGTEIKVLETPHRNDFVYLC